MAQDVAGNTVWFDIADKDVINGGGCTECIPPLFLYPGFFRDAAVSLEKCLVPPVGYPYF